MMAPVVGSGACPPWMARVAKARLSVFLIIAGTGFLSMSSPRKRGPIGIAAYRAWTESTRLRRHGSLLARGRLALQRLPHLPAQVVEQVDAGDEAEELVAVHDDGDVILGEDREQRVDR